jgi:hypothetical protein
MEGLQDVHPAILLALARHKERRCIQCNGHLEHREMCFKVNVCVPVFGREDVFVFSPQGHERCLKGYLKEVYPILIKYASVGPEVSNQVILNAKKLLTGLCCCHCSAIEYQKEKFAKCSGCKSVLYCGVECQKADWTANHKKECARLKDLQVPPLLESFEPYPLFMSKEISPLKCIADRCKNTPLNHLYTTFSIYDYELTVFACSLHCLRTAYVRVNDICMKVMDE